MTKSRVLSNRPTKKGSKLIALTLHDWVLLAVLAFLGLVVIRISLIVTILFSACAEDIASSGLEAQGFGFDTLWDAFYICTWLAAAYAFAIILTSETRNFVHTLFRGFCLCGLLLLAQGLRLMIADDAMRPDGYLYVDRLLDPYDDLGALREDFITFNYAQVIGHQPASFDPACIYLDRRTIIVAERPSNRDGSKAYSSFQLGFGSKGRLIDAMQLSERRIEFTPEEREMVLARLQPVNQTFSRLPYPAQIRDEPSDYRAIFGLDPESDD